MAALKVAKVLSGQGRAGQGRAGQGRAEQVSAVKSLQDSLGQQHQIPPGIGIRKHSAQLK